MIYRNPDTGRFITKKQWESLQAAYVDEYEDYEDLDDWDSLGEEEVY